MNFLGWFLNTKKLKLNILKLRCLCILIFILQRYKKHMRLSSYIDLIQKYLVKVFIMPKMLVNESCVNINYQHYILGCKFLIF